MKNYVWIGLCSLLALSHVKADVLLEAKAAYFRPTDSTFREIYNQGGRYGAELSFQLCNQLYGWTSADYFTKSGKSIGGHHNTRITLVPIGLGLKYFFPINSWDFYLGAGGLGTYFLTKDHSPYVIRSNHKWGFGGIAKAGFLWNHRCFFIDLFGDYSWVQKIHFRNTDHGKVSRHSADINGWGLGAALGYRFGGCCN